MGRKRHTAEQVIRKLREAQVLLAHVVGSWVGLEDMHFEPDVNSEAEKELSRLLADDENPLVRLAALAGLISMKTAESVRSLFNLGRKDLDEVVRCGLVARAGDLMRGGLDARFTARQVRTFLWSQLGRERAASSLGVAKRARLAQKYYSTISMRTARVDIEEAAMNALESSRIALHSRICCARPLVRTRGCGRRPCMPSRDIRTTRRWQPYSGPWSI